ncbi:MAG: hypothetical protein PHE41_08250 [Eubacteriales bacterium]|nr:hypothetical protein [Eubacteriales bacterium]
MNYNIIVYLAILTTAGTGAVLTWSNYYKRQLMKARRWRLPFYSKKLNDYFPISIFKAIIDRRRKEKMDLEIYEGISFLRNMTAMGRGSLISSDTVVELLTDHGGILFPIYAKMLQLLRQNQKERAIHYFSEIVGTEISKDFARLLIQWDEIDPNELMENLLSHQKNIKETRLTIRKRQNEMISDLIYLPVVINIMLIFINFIYVGYFIDQKEMLTMLL